MTCLMLFREKKHNYLNNQSYRFCKKNLIYKFGCFLYFKLMRVVLTKLDFVFLCFLFCNSLLLVASIKNLHSHNRLMNHCHLLEEIW
jgi:hypothetical protein